MGENATAKLVVKYIFDLFDMFLTPLLDLQVMHLLIPVSIFKGCLNSHVHLIVQGVLLMQPIFTSVLA